MDIPLLFLLEILIMKNIVHLLILLLVLFVLFLFLSNFLLNENVNCLEMIKRKFPYFHFLILLFHDRDFLLLEFVLLLNYFLILYLRILGYILFYAFFYGIDFYLVLDFHDLFCLFQDCY